MTDQDRRGFLRQLAQASAWAVAASYVLRLGPSRAAASPLSFSLDSERVFDLSVASGDPSPTGVMLWTRVRPEAVVSGAPLYLQVAMDAGFNQLVLEAEVPAQAVSALSDYTVRVDLDGRLAPATRYFYRFIYAGIASRTGRCRTLPQGSVKDLTFALLTCQDYTNGYYGALRHVADDDDVDFVLHLGDFIYESAADPRFQALPFADREVVLPSGQGVALGLADYRHLYRTYRRDPDLQRLLERHTLIVVHDDHETANDCYWDYDLDTLGAPDHPLRDDPGALRALKLASQRAWLEYVPARVAVNQRALHPHDYFASYRGFAFGDLVSLSMLDTRTYRTPHPCGEGDVLERYLPLGCKALRDPAQSMLGDRQADWLVERLSSSHALWNVIGNQTFFAPLALAGKLPLNVDAWDGYEAERRWLTAEIAARKIDNLVVLTGDLHSYVASQIKQDYKSLNPFDTNNQVGVEFMTPAVTSSSLFEMLRKELRSDSKLVDGLTEAAVRVNNPHIRYFNSSQHGYSTIRFTRSHCEWTAYAVDKNVASAAASRRVMARFRKLVSWPFLVEMPV